MITKNKILALSPHTDDIELSCGGTLAKLKANGADIKIIVFSHPPNKAEIIDEFKKSMKILDVKYEILTFPIRWFPNQRQEILETLFLESKKNYDLVFCPSSFDTHQDHEVIRQEAFRAFKTISVLGYELKWNNREFRKDMFVKLDDVDLQKKEAMLNCYKTQEARPYFQKDFMLNNAKMCGMQINVGLAEAFEVIRWVV